MSPLKSFVLLILCAASAPAQQQPKPGDMQVRVNYMNVCSPSDADKKEIVSALERIPTAPRFGPEFEIARGRSTAPDAPIASWVRVRREFPPDVPLINAQYSVSLDAQDIIETVVFRWREPKDVMQVSIEDSVSNVASPATVVSTDTPASRIRIERFGKPSAGPVALPSGRSDCVRERFRGRQPRDEPLPRGPGRAGECAPGAGAAGPG